MKLSLAHALAVAATLAVAAALASIEPPGAGARSCYSIWAEVEDGMGSSYRHIVYVENDCEEWMQCSVWTDVNPQPPKMFSVGPGATESAETNGRSEYDDPKAFGACHRT